MGVENYYTKVPKGTPLRQICSNKSFGVCGSSVGLTLYDGEKKKYARIAIGKSMSSITLRRYRAVTITNWLFCCMLPYVWSLVHSVILILIGLFHIHHNL